MLVSRRLLPLGVLACLALAVPAGAQASAHGGPAAHAAQDDDEVVLPGRVAGAIKRADRSLDNAADHIDEGEYAQSVVSLRALRRNMARADRAATAQHAAMPAEDTEEAEEAEESAEDAASPVDSVVAVLGLEHRIAEDLSGLFDTTSGEVVDGLTHAMFRTLNTRDRMLAAVTGLDPEGAGADFADAMADTVGDYDDEVVTFTAALAADELSPGGQRVMTAALAQVQATQAAVNAAYGGGE